MQSSNENLTQKIIEVFEEKTSVQGNTYDSVEHIVKNDTIVRRHVDAFDIYKKYLKDKTRILDWGCRRAIDAYLIQTYLPQRADIYGCDVTEQEKQNFLYDYAELEYTQLTHPYTIPYDDNYFDVVIGSGVLEHVPNDYESLKELYRIINNDGYLIITFLPNYLSYTEFIARKFRNGKAAHRRNYSISRIKKLLLHSGFLPVHYGYHQVLPSFASFSSEDYKFQKLEAFQALISKFYNLNKYAEKTWPINQFAANIFVIAQKQLVM